MIKANIELWKDVKDYEGLYQVSTFGRVRSFDKYIDVKIRNVDKVLKRGKILKQVYTKGGYLKVSLCKNGKRTRLSVHRLVAEAFIPNPLNLPVINHKDEVKDNNYLYNLEWCTVKYNSNYGTAIKRSAEKRSKKVYQYDLKGNLIKEWSSAYEAGRNGFTRSHVSKCCLGKQKTHKGYIWSYEELA
ncbi:MAG: NUMOD4 domain-containing protein [Clostridium sp.]|nr:NUMOD4 domain-containing protein [Clostridium sp.]